MQNQIIKEEFQMNSEVEAQLELKKKIAEDISIQIDQTLQLINYVSNIRTE